MGKSEVTVMKVASTVLCGFMLLGSRLAGAQEATVTVTAPEALSEETPQAVQPPEAAPMQLPPAPPSQPPPPPVESDGQAQQQQQQQEYQQVVPQPQAAAAGQWVYTDQYGWIWMPYGTQYTYEGSSAYDSQPY